PSTVAWRKPPRPTNWPEWKSRNVQNPKPYSSQWAICFSRYCATCSRDLTPPSVAMTCGSAYMRARSSRSPGAIRSRRSRAVCRCVQEFISLRPSHPSTDTFERDRVLETQLVILFREPQRVGILNDLEADRLADLALHAVAG